MTDLALSRLTLSATRPVALDSVDHQHPMGTLRDNSVNPAFNRKLYQLFPAGEISVLDLGCAGGGFVKSVLDDGHLAIGVEGSDLSAKQQRGEWATIPDYLFTADATAPFQVERDGQPARFSAVTAWEFLEHIAERDLPAVFDNIRRHLLPGGLVIASINTHSSRLGYEPELERYEMHATIRPQDWWTAWLRERGWERQPDLESHFGTDWIRSDPYSFHVVLVHVSTIPDLTLAPWQATLAPATLEALRELDVRWRDENTGGMAQCAPVPQRLAARHIRGLVGAHHRGPDCPARGDAHDGRSQRARPNCLPAIREDGRPGQYPDNVPPVPG